MKTARGYELWTHPERAMPEPFCRLSYALFRTALREGEVLCARCPQPERLAPGDNIFDALGLCPEAYDYLQENSVDLRPLFLLTNVGLGLLDKRYDRHAGVGLFLHIHGRPKALGRLINHGVLGDPDGAGFRVSQEVKALGDRVSSRDEASWLALAEARAAILRDPREAYLGADGEGYVYSGEFARRLERMAAFTGSRLRLQAGEMPLRARCYRPLLQEACLLGVLTEIATVARGGEAEYCLSTLDGQSGGSLSLLFRYEIERSALDGRLYQRLEEARRSWALHSEIGGLELHAAVKRPTRSEARSGLMPTVELTLEWLRDPAMLPTSDLKAGIRLRGAALETWRRGGL